MPKGAFLGEFELHVLAALVRLGDAAYGMTIRQDIEQRGQRRASVGSVYATLDRLADKGYATFVTTAPVIGLDGRARKFVRITPAGRRALRDATHAIGRMVHGLGLGLGLD